MRTLFQLLNIIFTIGRIILIYYAIVTIIKINKMDKKLDDINERLEKVLLLDKFKKNRNKEQEGNKGPDNNPAE